MSELHIAASTCTVCRLTLCFDLVTLHLHFICITNFLNRVLVHSPSQNNCIFEKMVFFLLLCEVTESERCKHSDKVCQPKLACDTCWPWKKACIAWNKACNSKKKTALKLVDMNCTCITLVEFTFDLLNKFFFNFMQSHKNGWQQ